MDETQTEGAGAVFSNALDYSKWVRMMMNRDGPISAAGHEALVTPHMIAGKIPEFRSLVMYGYGWEIEMYRGCEIIYHNGAESGVNLEDEILYERY